MKVHEDVQSLQIEINVQSAGMIRKEQIFYTADDDKMKPRDIIGQGNRKPDRTSRTLNPQKQNKHIQPS